MVGRRGTNAGTRATRFLILDLVVGTGWAWAQLEGADRHGSPQFPRPAQAAQMAADTGMTDGVGAFTVSRMKWHDGKLWMAGAWEAGIDATDFGRRLANEYWYLWTWSPVDGYQVVAHYHSSQGGRGPDGVINDFVFLPDGRLVVGGEFGRLDNPGGGRPRVHRIVVDTTSNPRRCTWVVRSSTSAATASTRRTGRRPWRTRPRSRRGATTSVLVDARDVLGEHPDVQGLAGRPLQVDVAEFEGADELVVPGGDPEVPPVARGPRKVLTSMRTTASPAEKVTRWLSVRYTRP